MSEFKQIFDGDHLKGKGQCKPQKVFKFTWEYCEMCDCMFVRCPKCGNNCCNASFGRTTKDGLPTTSFDEETTITCDVCNLAYMYQELADKTNFTPKHEK
jgi:hypothetical protein